MSVVMETVNGNSPARKNKSSKTSPSVNREKKSSEKDTNKSPFINHAAIAWYDNRRKWVGDHSRRSRRKADDPVISWSTSYEDLLSTTEPFSEPIPLAEMVDFLVDIWHDEGLFD